HGGGPARDLYVEAHTQKHPIFEREADNLHVSVRVPMVDAAHGTTFPVEHLDGETLDIDIEPGTQPGEAISIDDKGMPRLRTDGHGKLYAHVDVVVPTNLDKKSNEMLEHIRDRREEATKVHSADDNDGEGFFDRLRDRFRR